MFPLCPALYIGIAVNGVVIAKLGFPTAEDDVDDDDDEEEVVGNLDLAAEADAEAEEEG